MSRLAPVVGLVLIAAGCTVKLDDPAGRACNEEKPCAGGRVCIDGRCVTPGADGGAVPCTAADEGQPCTVGVGECKASGTSVCVEGWLDCSAQAGSPAAEVCDGLDNDCDGAIDEPEDMLPPTCRNQGICAGTPAPICRGAAGWTGCDYPPGFEETEQSCDGLDNDCNGIVDDVSGCLYTITGSGPRGFQNGQGIRARFTEPGFLTIGPDGALYVTEFGNHTIRRIDRDGNVSTIAGTGRCGSADGPVATAELCEPLDLEFDADGVLYFSEWGGNRLRKIVDGMVVTVAGTGGWGLSNGDALLQAEFRGVTGIDVLPNGDVLIADFENHRIRRFIASTNTVVTEAGTTPGHTDGTATTMQLLEPIDVAQGWDGTLYIVELGGNRIRVLPPGGTSRILAGSPNGSGNYVEGVGTAARFEDPSQGLLDEEAAIFYVADGSNGRVRAVPLDGTSTYPVVGGSGWGFRNGTSAQAAFKYLAGIARDGITWYLSDAETHTVRRGIRGSTFASSVVEDFVGAPAGVVNDGAPSEVTMYEADGLSLAPDGRFYWAEWEPHLVRMLDTDGLVKTLVGDPTAPTSGYVNGALAVARLSDPHRTTVGPDGKLYVAEGQLSGIRVIDLTTGTVSTFAGPLPPEGDDDWADGALHDARFDHPIDITFGQNREGERFAYVADQGNAVVRRIAFPNGPVTTWAGTVGSRGFVDGPGTAAKFDGPEALLADDQGNVYVADGDRLRKIDASANVTTLLADLGFAVKDLAFDGEDAIVLCGDRQLVRYSFSTRQLTWLLDLEHEGVLDGTSQTASAWEFRSVVVQPEAYYLLDSGGGRLRRLWR